MHLVTSSLFISSIFSLLKRSSQELLLRGYFATCLVWYIGRGRPELDIARFFKNATTLHPVPPGPKPTPHKDVSPSATSPYALTPDPWLPIIQSSLTHPDDHLPKLQRALAEYSSHFGSTPAGYFSGTELKDAELIDGTLFVRVAGLTAGRLGWVREGEPPSSLLYMWDVRGFHKVADEI
jgi:Questin oxidase-like